MKTAYPDSDTEWWQLWCCSKRGLNCREKPDSYWFAVRHEFVQSKANWEILVIYLKEVPWKHRLRFVCIIDVSLWGMLSMICLWAYERMAGWHHLLQQDCVFFFISFGHKVTNDFRVSGSCEVKWFSIIIIETKNGSVKNSRRNSSQTWLRNLGRKIYEQQQKPWLMIRLSETNL